MDLPVSTRIWRCGFAIWLMLFALFLTAGCASNRGQTQEQEAEKRTAKSRAKSAEALKKSIVGGQHQISIQELDQLTYAYADRYYMAVSDAIDSIKSNNPDPTQRRIAQQLKVNGVLSMDDIVSGNDPYSQVFDLVTTVTLESILIIDENRAEKVFGDRGRVLIKAIRVMRVEAWELAAKVLTQDQLELLDYIILEWRRRHPKIEKVAYVKFDNFAEARAAGLLTEVKSGHGFLAPLHEASAELTDVRRLTERVFWYTKRAPNIAAIEAEAAVNEILSAPEVNSTIQTSERLGKLIESVPKLVETERKAILADLDARQSVLTNTLGDVRHIVADVNSLARSIPNLATNIQQTLVTANGTLKVVEQAGRNLGINQPSTNPPTRPFEIRDYTIAFERLNEAVTNLHELSLGANQMTRSEGWKQAVTDLSAVMDRRINRIFVRLFLLLAVFFVLAVGYRVIATKLAQHAARSPRNQR